MDCRKANIALITIVSVLLIISCLVLVKFLFSDSKGFSWGSVSDWFTAICSLLSAVGTLGTLYIAYLAYKKVPEWMSQKHYDIAYGIIEKSIYNDLRALRPLSYSIQSNINIILSVFKTNIDCGKANTEVSSEDIAQIDKQAISFQQQSDVIIEQLNAVKRTNYELTDDANNVISLLTKARITYLMICDELYELNDKLSFFYSGDDGQKTEYITKITDLHNSTKGNNAFIIKMINDIRDGNKAISDFITPKKQKHP